MEPVQQEERRSLGEEEEQAGGPMYLLPPDSEGNDAGNDAEDDKLASSFSYSPSPKSPPRGRWKDGLCNWHKNYAPSCLMGSLLNSVLLGQVAQRMKYCLRFKEVTLISLGLWTLFCVLYIVLPKNGGLSNLAYSLFFLLVLCQLRGVVRARYAIPGDQFSDCCASLWCSCCTLTQMARHVFNYQGNCGECSLGPDADSFVILV